MRADHTLAESDEVQEIYNTYGPHQSSAQILVRYGFCLEANETDAVVWESNAHVAAACQLPHEAGLQDVPYGALYIDSEGRCSSHLRKLLEGLPTSPTIPENTLYTRMINSKLATMPFSDQPITLMLDERDELQKLDKLDCALALGYLIGQRQLLEASK